MINIQLVIGIAMSTIFIVILIALFLMLKNETKSKFSVKYEKQTCLLNAQELIFYRFLHLAIKNKYQIFTKVRVFDVLKPTKASSKEDWQKVFNIISKKHFDFVLCDPLTLKVMFVIELIEENNKNARMRDKLLEDACQSANLHLFVITAKKTYNQDELSKIFLGPNNQKAA